MIAAAITSRQPVVDLAFCADGADAGRAELWLPELLMFGHSDDGRVWAEGAVPWRGGTSWAREGTNLGYEHDNEDGSLSLAASVTRRDRGWSLALTVANPTDTPWSNIVACVCLQLPAFVDPDWQRTYYRAGGRHLSYADADCAGGRDPYRMSLVHGRQQLLRTQHHLQANRTPSFRCIHANPFFGDLEPGAGKTLRGWVLLTPGGLDAAWEGANAVVAGEST